MIDEGNKIGFVDLLKNNVVEIPIIQRDYAQGRIDKEELRVNFLLSLKSAINQQHEINLDFIYGSKTNDAMQPLDGQQRLTTLFLLYWYAATKDSELSNNIDLLKRFTYETRTSSREFCVSLIEKSIEEIDFNTIVSDEIRNSIWYFLTWDNDPTIDSMLRTLDDIHKYFYEEDNLWGLLNSEKPIISFYYIELSNFGLSDDLYIKMNARGKELTSFENFKATFEKKVKNDKWDANKSFNETFSCKVDTIWTDLFWKHRVNNLVDSPLLSLFSTIAMLSFALEKPENRHNSIRLLQADKRSIKASMYSKFAYEYLHKYADMYHEIYDSVIDLKVDFPFEQFIYNKDVFRTMFSRSGESSYTQKVVFYAQTEYLLNVGEFNREYFLDWMRVIRNIVYRGDYNRTSSKASIVRSPESFDGIINLIKELTIGCENIYNHLVSCSIKSQIARSQIEEEVLKAKIIQQNIESKKIIHEAEDLGFTSGSIQIIFDAMDFKSTSVEFDVNRFISVMNVIKKYIDKGISNDLRRILLTIDVDGEYTFYNYWWSWSQVVDGNKRCLITNDSEMEYFALGKYKENEIFKKYFIKMIRILEKDDPETYLSNYSPPSTMRNWKKKLIKDSSLLDQYCISKYIVIPKDESCCYLLKGIRPRDMQGVFKIE